MWRNPLHHKMKKKALGEPKQAHINSWHVLLIIRGGWATHAACRCCRCVSSGGLHFAFSCMTCCMIYCMMYDHPYHCMICCIYIYICGGYAACFKCARLVALVHCSKSQQSQRRFYGDCSQLTNNISHTLFMCGKSPPSVKLNS